MTTKMRQGCMLLALMLTVLPAADGWRRADAMVHEVFEYNGDSHFEFGQALGRRFRAKIAERIQHYTTLQHRLLPYVKTPPGRALYEHWVQEHDAAFPHYVDELRGLADGSGVPFETIMVLNLAEEFTTAIPSSYAKLAHAAARRARPILHCSDMVLVGGPEDLRIVAHNEDSAAWDVNHTAIVKAKIGKEPAFLAYTYLGELPTGAFGVNDKGVAFTLNFVQPADIDPHGLGRNFISRDVLGAVDADNALRRIAHKDQSAGHNFQLMDVPSRRIWNAEAASWDRVVEHEWVQNASNPSQVTAFFHANQYQLLNISQPPYESSLHRLARYKEFPTPKTLQDALTILGDQKDRAWPVFHDVLSHERGDQSGWTLTTIVFNLTAHQAAVLTGNPAKHQVEALWDLDTLTITKP